MKREKYGLTCDNIVGARVVTADGVLLDVNEENHPDLFWAIRGGGGNFGVVTRFEFALHAVGPEVLALDVMYDFKDAKQVLQKAQRFLAQAPDEAVSLNLTAAVLPPVPFLPEFLHHKKVIMLLGMYAGDDDVCKQWVDSFYAGLLPFSHKHASYLNAIGISEDVTNKAFQENYSRLMEVKKTYDPDNRFCHNHNINPEG